MVKRRWKQMLAMLLSAGMIWSMSGLTSFASDDPVPPADDPPGMEVELTPPSGPSSDPSTEPNTDSSNGPSSDPSAGPNIDPSNGPSSDLSTGPSMEPNAGPSMGTSDGEGEVPKPVPLNVQDPTVTFKVTYVPRNGSDVVEYVNSGDTVYFDVGKHSFIKIVPEIEHPLAGEDKGDFLLVSLG